MFSTAMRMIALIQTLLLVTVSLLVGTSGQQCGIIQDTCSNKFYSLNYWDVFNCEVMFGVSHGIKSRIKCAYLTSCASGRNAPDCIKHCQFYKRSTTRKKRSGIDCELNERYRSITGECNNIHNPRWGQFMTPFTRLLPAVHDDGMSTPRQTSACGGDLPSARAISNIIHQTQGPLLLEKKASYMVMQWGQFITHDMDLTPIQTKPDGESFDCCGEDKDDDACFSIVIPPDDPVFDSDCMAFTRSDFIIVSDVAENINTQTSYIDASVVYGPNEEVQTSLRADGGLLISIKRKLGIDFDDSNCRLRYPLDTKKYYCLLAGDLRVSEQPGLSSMHTVFSREHNRIVRKLAKINPHWNDDTLYGEARKIVAAEIQLINYREWLPIVLGTRTVKESGLSIKSKGFCDTYDDTVDASVDNGFATASLRFGHSLIHDLIARVNKKRKLIDEHPLQEHYFNPLLYHLKGSFGTDSMLNWMAGVKCPRADRFMQSSARDKLFLDTDGISFDLAALNIQRGRDHGLPNYNEYRELCGLPRATSFDTGPGGLVDHDPEIAAFLDTAYSGCIDDIDLFVGILTERRIEDSLTGPLLQCLLVKQFKKAKDGDRFWFERNVPVTGFTEAQLNEIKKTTLTSVMCANTGLIWLQRNSFLSPRKSKRRSPRSLVRCDRIRQINFMHWRDRR